MREIEIHRQGLRDFQMGGKFFSVISGDAFKRYDPLEQSNHSLGDQIGLFAGEAVQQGKAQFTFCQRDDHTLLIFSKHQVDFPITETGALLDNLRTLFDTLSVGDFAPAIMFTITLATLLLAAQVGP